MDCKNYNTDGFNERTIYIQNSNDKNKLKSNNFNFDTSLSKMKVDENKPKVETTSNNVEFTPEVLTNNEQTILQSTKLANMQNQFNRNKFNK